jgi:adenylate kinase
MINNECMALVITGNPGVGKHTIAEEILKSNSYEFLDINKIAIKAEIIENNQDVLDVDVDKLKSYLDNMVQEKSILVGHLAPYVVDSLKINSVIVLRKNPYELRDIYKKRGYSEKKIKDNLGSEILGIVTNDAINTFGIKKTFQIDTSNSTSKTIVKKINSIIDRTDSGDIIDWLPLIQEKNDFKTFFEY